MLATLIQRRPITGRDTLYTFRCPALAQAARPGQFVELKLPDANAFLRRPISIFDCDGTDTVSLLVRTVGRGTEAMTRWAPSLEVDLLGPLGRGFSWSEQDRLCTLVAGGIGLAPLNYLARALLRQDRQVRLLFSPRRDSTLLAALPEAQRLDLHFADSRKELPDALDRALAGADRAFACGPEGMLELTAQRTAALHIPCQLSMERRMACGIGICLGCAIAIRAGDGTIIYQKVCQDGPVFRAEEVAFHEQP